MTTKFSLKLKTESIVITNAQGKDENWELREMISAERDKFMDLLKERVELDGEGNVKTIKKVEGTHNELLTRTLFLNGIPVKADVLNSWPATAVGELYRQSQILNGLTKAVSEQQAEAKKA
jgi:hypothetical protein